MNPWDIVGAIGLIVIALIYIVFVITVTPAFNYLTEWTREHDDKFILSIDWGDERAAMSVSTWNKRRYPWLIFIDAVTFSGGTMEDYIQRIRRYQSMYDNLTIVADYGGVAKSIVRELREVHRIPIVNAEKT
ncbi:MAG: hypothetical protein QNJ16_21355, partial [Rhodobacter sp.]|nr:hypothetical protein [Rhodobacter sp.]